MKPIAEKFDKLLYMWLAGTDPSDMSEFTRRRIALPILKNGARDKETKRA